ncbi:MAG: hypothetical protein OXH63_17390, partial [Gemmatimonadetes bacterium]|nr:hypothetical protein [Gemmatimonadota bacterium]
MFFRQVFSRALLTGVVMSLMGVTVCVGHSTNVRSSSINLREFEAIKKALEESVSEELIQTLKDWNAIPTWTTKPRDLRTDWLKTLHENVTEDGWPQALRDAAAGTIKGEDEILAFATQGNHSVIGIYDSTPAYLSQLLKITNHPFVPPGSPDPHAPMILDPDRGLEAVKKLAKLLGMLRETSYLDGPAVVWRPAVILGARFIYYHELGHLLLNGSDDVLWRFAIEPIENELSEELYADRFALAMLILETRSNPEIQGTALAGVAFAMALIASQEFVDAKEEGSIEWAALRMARLQHWARMAVDLNELSPRALDLLNFYWILFTKMLQQVENVPSPISALLRQTSGLQNSEWTMARDRMAKWCRFG